MRESRDRLREPSAALQTVREAEKTRIARELHDEFGRHSPRSNWIPPPLTASSIIRKRAACSKQLIDTTVLAVQRILADLRPVMLDNLGLVPTLEWPAKDFSGRTGIAVELDLLDDDPTSEGDAATALFRFAQESLTNVARHPGANNMIIELQRCGGTAVLRIVDNGKGIGDADRRKARSFGLLGMRARIGVGRRSESD